MKRLFSSLFILLFSVPAFSQQDCEVSVESLKGKYTGECKSGKANGQGKANGTDSYEGNFKNGYPSGEGLYTYKNGDFYNGIFKKGLKDGKGEFHYKKTDVADSVVTGYWKNDEYIGLYATPYTVGQKSDGIVKFEVRKESSGGAGMKTLTITSANVIKMNSLGGGAPPLAVINYFNVDEGSYEREERTTSGKTSVLTLYGLKFPLHIRTNYDGQSFDILFSQDASWSIDVEISAR